MCRAFTANPALAEFRLKPQYTSALQCTLKVSKSRKQILKFSFEPKNKQKYFCIYALASKKRLNQKNKGTLDYRVSHSKP